ncbi:hypothetical protein HKBW3S03_02010, partial [Candidatus Hakubella thermalkaliphila]
IDHTPEIREVIMVVGRKCLNCQHFVPYADNPQNGLCFVADFSGETVSSGECPFFEARPPAHQ